jgi:hypothetical protein
MKVTCAKASKVFDSMGNCEKSPLKLTAIKTERPLQVKDITLEGFPESFMKARTAGEKEKAEKLGRPKPEVPPNVTDSEGEDTVTEADIAEVPAEGAETKKTEAADPADPSEKSGADSGTTETPKPTEEESSDSGEPEVPGPEGV